MANADTNNESLVAEILDSVDPPALATMSNSLTDFADDWSEDSEEYRNLITHPTGEEDEPEPSNDVSNLLSVTELDRIFKLDKGPKETKTNHITNVLKDFLKSSYVENAPQWAPDRRQYFHEQAKKMSYAVSRTRITVSSSRIGKEAAKDNGKNANWVHVWFLRIMFGPEVTSKQVYYSRIVKEYCDLDTAGWSGIIPKDAARIIDDEDTNWFPVLTREWPYDAEELETKRKNKEFSNELTKKKMKVYAEPDNWFKARPLPTNANKNTSLTGFIRKLDSLELEFRQQKMLQLSQERKIKDLQKENKNKDKRIAELEEKVELLRNATEDLQN